MGNFWLFLLQLGVILGFSCLAGAAFRRIGQPQVVGEMAAGFALGPTAFGAIAPQAFGLIFPPESLAILTTFAEACMAVFLFLAGMRVDFAELRRQSRVATAAAIGSMALPFVAGLILAQHLYARYGRGSAWDFGFFLAIAMSVTAFPVLARILSERRLLETPLGATAIAGAAFDDVTARIMLALVFVAIVSKWGGTALGGRIGGASWRTALWLGALMNTRGLVELIVLNAGMERGILSPISSRLWSRWRCSLSSLRLRC